MRRLIFGCGYLGRRAAEAWLANGDQVFALTRSAESAELLSTLGVEPVVGDVTFPESLASLPDADTILYSVGFDRNAGPTKREVYVDGLRNVLRAVEGRCRRFVHISSTSVYGQQDGEEIDESSPAKAAHESGVICREAEHLVTELSQSNQTPTTILRLSGIYGPDRLLSRVEAIRAGLKLPGPADAWLNLIHVDDAVSVVLKAASATDLAPLYLVSDDEPVRRRDYYESLARLVEAPAPEFDPVAVARHTRGLGKRCRNQLLKKEMGIALQFPTIATGLPHALGDADSS
jgi:nucleoside-diphosphate-sugar epimerase